MLNSTLAVMAGCVLLQDPEEVLRFSAKKNPKKTNEPLFSYTQHNDKNTPDSFKINRKHGDIDMTKQA